MNQKSLLTALKIGFCTGLVATLLFCKDSLETSKPENYIKKVQTEQKQENPKPRTFLNWNTQAFGKKKASNPKLMDTYQRVMTNYDIIFVQEIRDSSDESFRKLCSILKQYKHRISSRAGRSTSKEQYGVFFREDINLINFKDFNPEYTNSFERPPIAVDFEINDYTIRVYNIHTKPTAAGQEIGALEKLVTGKGNIIVLGDLNASGGYYNRAAENQFSGWNWVIRDNEDTTVAASTNAYDRIIMNPDSAREYISHGIFTNVTKDVSDHYPVYVEILPKEK